MRDYGGQGSLVAETLGLEMARRAAEILQRHREMPGLVVGGDGAAAGDAEARAGGRAGNSGGRGAAVLDPAQFAADEAVFSTVLDAVNECMGRFDTRPASDRWCDALLQLLQLAESSADA
jgi:hypothetical protein